MNKKKYHDNNIKLQTTHAKKNPIYTQHKQKKIKKNKMQPSTAAKKILKRFSATNPDFRPTTRV